MAITSKDDLSYLEVSRPVVDGFNGVYGDLRTEGDRIFGFSYPDVYEEPRMVEQADGMFAPMTGISGVPEPNLNLYPRESLRLPLVDLVALPGLKYGRKLHRAYERATMNPEVRTDHKLVSDEVDEKEPPELRALTGLAGGLHRIAKDYGIFDHREVQVECLTVSVPIDVAPMQAGKEVWLMPDATSAVGLMLIDQAKLILRAIGRKDGDLVNPSSPTNLRIPIARMPYGADHEQEMLFLKRVKANIPLKLTLGLKEGSAFLPRDLHGTL